MGEPVEFLTSFLIEFHCTFVNSKRLIGPVENFKNLSHNSGGFEPKKGYIISEWMRQLNGFTLNAKRG